MQDNVANKMLTDLDMSEEEFYNVRKNLESDEAVSQEALVNLAKTACEVVENSAAPHNWGTIDIWIPFDREFPNFFKINLNDLNREDLLDLVRKLFAFLYRADDAVSRAGSEYIYFFGEEARREGIGYPDQYDIMTYSDYYDTQCAVKDIMNAFKDGCDEEEFGDRLEEEIRKQGEKWGLDLGLGQWLNSEDFPHYGLPENLVIVGIGVNDYSFLGDSCPAYVIFKQDDEDGCLYPYHSFVDIAD